MKFFMVRNKYTPEGLPIVLNKVLEDYEKECSNNVDTDGCLRAANNVRNRIQKDNPELFFYKQSIGEHLNIEEQITFDLGFGMAYELLRRQAKANKLF